MTNMTYLHIRGLLYENMVYSPLPGYESRRRGRTVEGDPAFQLALLNDAGETLLALSPEVKPSGCRAAEDPLDFDVRGLLPLNPLATAYELRKGEILLHRFGIPRETPTAPEVHCNCTDTTISVNWTADCDPAQDGDFGTTYSIAVVMQSGQRFTLASNLAGSNHTCDLGKMPVPGKGVICLGIHDGVRSTEIEIREIQVPFRAPVVHILKPEPYTRLPFGQPVSILGCCLGMDGNPYSSEGVSWRIDGALFEIGSNVVALENLQPGEHLLSLCHEGDDPAYRTETSVIVEIEEPGAHHALWASLTENLDNHQSAS